MKCFQTATSGDTVSGKGCISAVSCGQTINQQINGLSIQGLITCCTGDNCSKYTVVKKMNEWTNERTDEQTNERTKEQTDRKLAVLFYEQPLQNKHPEG